MPIGKILMATGYLAFLASSVAAQCAKVDPTKIQLRGITLGTSSTAISTRFSRVPISEPDYAGVAKGVLIFEEAGPSVDRMEVQFLDGKAYSIEVQYDYTVQFQNVQQFAVSVAKSLNLPNLWRRHEYPGAASGMIISCRTFELQAWIVRGTKAIVWLYDPVARRTIAARYAALERKRRSEFKP